MQDIEVEKKFVLSEGVENRLIEGAELINTKTFMDSYYDTDNFSLTINDLWLRNRAGAWELKVSLSQNKDKFADRYEEIKEEKHIREFLKLSSKSEFNNVLVQAGFSVFCECTTTRTKYRNGLFLIDIDHVTYSGTDYTYSVAEIERMVKSESDIEGALQEIIDFAKSRGIDLVSVLGKVHVYIKNTRPDHYKALIESGTIKSDQIGETD